MAYAPDALLYFSREMVKIGGSSSGIVGDSAHTYGYHRARNELPSSDYSVQLQLDREGAAGAASAVDWSMSDSLMRTVTARLRDAALHAEDDRLDVVREFYGTLNSSSVYGLSHNGYGQTWDFASADSTHLWHIHLSFFRKHSNDHAGIDKVLSVVRGESWTAYKARIAQGAPPTNPAPAPPPEPSAPAGTPAFPLQAGHVFGDINGPNEVHGGHDSAPASDRTHITAIQKRLQVLGYAPNVSGWADGYYEQPTIDAVRAMQAGNGLLVDGQVGPATWNRLFSGTSNTNPVPSVPQPAVKLRVLSGVQIDDVGKIYIRILERLLPDDLLKRMYVTSNFRNNGYSDYHGATDDKGAVDFSAVMTSQGAVDRRDAAKLMIRYAQYQLELIHTTPFADDNGFYVKNGSVVGQGYYGGATEAAHVDHIHTAGAQGRLEAMLNAIPAKVTAPPPPPIPMPTPVPPVPADPPKPPGGLAATYTVKSGDTLSGIAKRFGVTVEGILKLNPSITDRNKIKVGQVLRMMP